MCRLRWHVNGHASGLGWKTFYCRICCRQVNALKCRHTRRCTRTWSTFLLAGPCPGFPATLNNKARVPPDRCTRSLSFLLFSRFNGEADLCNLYTVNCETLRECGKNWKLKSAKHFTFNWCVYACVAVCKSLCVCVCMYSDWAVQLSFKVAIRAASMGDRQPRSHWGVPSTHNGNSWDWTGLRVDEGAETQKQWVSKETACRPLSLKANVAAPKLKDCEDFKLYKLRNEIWLHAI